jgi:Uma2 family endonuclease
MNHASADVSNSKNNKNFVAPERSGVGKVEILDGREIPKGPANRAHNLISTNLAIGIGSRIQRNLCELYASDMQVQLGKNSICYPDIVVVNGEPAFADAKQELLKNPTVVIEIFAGGTHSSDRQQKLEGFLNVPHIKECLLVNESEMRVEHYARQNAKQWIYRIYNERDDVISLESIHCKLSLAEVYAQVKVSLSELSSKAVN